MKRDEIINILEQCIIDIGQGNYSSQFNGGYSYSKEITNIFNVLDDEKYRKIFDDNYYSYKVGGKELNNIEDISSFNIIECILYLNWLWHVDGSGLATGMINSKIKSGRYTELLKRLKELIANEN